MPIDRDIERNQTEILEMKISKTDLMRQKKGISELENKSSYKKRKKIEKLKIVF